MAKVFIGVAWPYANGSIHLGHLAGSLLPPDIFSRYHRMKGDEVLMVSGSDMHGTPVTVTADKEGITPLEVAERSHAINKAAIEGMMIDFSLFTKTHTENHMAVVQDVFLRLLENDLLYCKESMQYFCPDCDRFLPDRYVEGTCPECGFERARGDQCDNCGKTFDSGDLLDSRCIVCGESPELRETEHFYLRLSSFQDRLMEYVGAHDGWRSNVKTFTMNWLTEGLRDRPITRDMTYGIPVPMDGWEGKVIYVWFEAVIGYLSASKEYSSIVGDPDLWRSFWADPECDHYYFLGKDNIPFHSIIWPSILMGCGGLNLPDEIPANEFLTFGGKQFSKSRGVIVAVPDMLETYDPDVIRYYMSVNMPEHRDADFTWEDFETKVNNELVATLGNYYHRVLSFTHKHFGSVPAYEGDPMERERVLAEIASHVEEADAMYASCEFKKALRAVMDLAQFGNRYFDSCAPWRSVREDKVACGDSLNLNLEIVKALAILTQPFLPRSSGELWTMMGQEGTPLTAGWSSLTVPLEGGTLLQRPRPLFERVEIDEGDDMSDMEGFEGFTALDLRVGEIVDVGDHPDADKLYVMTVDIGEERTIVAGLKAFYTPDELRGRKVVCVANLKPAKLRGIKSQGMLLAAEEEGDENVQLLRPAADAANGDPVSSGLTTKGKRVSYSEFQAVSLRIGSVGEGVVNVDDELEMVTGPAVDLPDRVVVYVPEDGGRALVLSTPSGVSITVDRPIADGARIR